MRSKTKTNRTILTQEQIKLWVKAGGRCEICNEYLLKDSFTGRIFNFGEKAHNVGVGSGKSPRSFSLLTTEDRNKEENLLLLCPKHHKMIDESKYTGDFTVERLKQYKIEHEKRILYLTGLVDNRKSVILRMTNRIKEHSITISDEEVRKTLEICEGRYPADDISIEINLSSLPVKINSAYWKTGRQIIDESIERQIKPKTTEKLIKHISAFALARIPLLIYLGFRLGDKIPIDIYQKQRNEKEDWIWCTDEKPITFSFRCIQKGNNSSNVVLIASISGKINLIHLSEVVTPESTIYEIIPNEEDPHRNIIRSKATLTNFTGSYQRLMRQIEKECSQTTEILLYPALPLSAAIICGRELLPDTTPTLTIFDKEGDTYKKTFSINPKKRGTV